MADDQQGPERRQAERRPGSASHASETLRTSQSRPKIARRSRPQRLVLAVGGLLTVMVLLTACTVGYFNWRLGQIDRIDLGLAGAEPGEPANYLVVGSDSRAGIDAQDPDAGAFLNNEDYQVHPDGAGRRSDSIMVLRVDPSTKSAALLSFPRDLYVPISGTDRSDKINAAFSMGVGTLVDTIQDNFDIPIHHYVEVDFVGFRELIDAMGGVRLYFDQPMWDDHTGLNITTTGCHTLDGTQALAFARSRYLWYNTLGQSPVDTSSLKYLTDAQMEANGWHQDGTSDLGRISRQQVLIRNAIPQAERAAFRNPATLNAVMRSAVDSLRVDTGLTSGRLVDLAKQFRNFDPDTLVTYSYPGTPAESPSAGSILEPDTKAAGPIIAKFLGESPDAPETQVSIRVLNASGIDHQAGNVAGALERVGFDIAGTGDASSEGIGDLTTTQVRYAPGNEPAAVLAARHLSAEVEFVPIEGSTSDVVEVVTGSNFTTVTTERLDDKPVDLPKATTTTKPEGTDETEGSSTTTTTLVGVVPDQTDRSC